MRRALPLILGAMTLAPLVGGYVGCSSGVSSPPGGDLGTLRFAVYWPEMDTAAGALALAASGGEVSIRAIPPETQLIVVTVTGLGIQNPIVGDVTRADVVGDWAELVLRVPPGASRSVAVQARAQNGVVLTSAFAIVDISAGVTTDVKAPLHVPKVAWVRSGDVYVAAVDGTGLVNVSNDSDNEPEEDCLSADGRKVAWSANEPHTSLNDIYVANVDGTGIVNVTSSLPPTMEDTSPSLSADGSKVAWTRGSTAVYVASTDGTGIECIAPGSIYVDQSPSLSADGSKVAWSRRSNSSAADIYVANTDGTGVVNVSNDPGDDWGPSLSADGSTVAWSSNRDGVDEYTDDVYVANTDGTGLVNVSNHDAGDGRPSLSADGRRLAWHSNRSGNWEVYVSNADGTDLVNVSNGGSINKYYAPSLSADGSRVAWMDRRDGNYDVYVANADGTGLVNVSSTTSGSNSYPSLQGN